MAVIQDKVPLVYDIYFFNECLENEIERDGSMSW